MRQLIAWLITRSILSELFCECVRIVVTKSLTHSNLALLLYRSHVSLQENVSCLNTSLVILMLARRKAKLPFYLNALREKEYAEKYPGCLLNNFHNLLRFWQRHYLNKDKDSTCLENVSGYDLALFTLEASGNVFVLQSSTKKYQHNA